MQEQVAKKVTESYKLKVVSVSKEVISGYKKVSKKLVKLLDEKDINIIIYSVDRFSRNLVNGVKLARDLLKCGHTIYFIRENLKIESPRGKAWYTFIKYLEHAEHESKAISDRVKSVKSYLKEKGYFVGSKAPFGYKKQKLPNGRNVLVTDENANNIYKFIIDCKTAGTPVAKLHEDLKLCGVSDIDDNPIELSDDSEELNDSLDDKNIANLLNEYSVTGSPFSKAQVSKILNADLENFHLETKLEQSITCKKRKR
jgi:DNA invertase Pin-like site-specific DNA recombinase